MPESANRWDIGPVLGLDIVGMPVLDTHVKANMGALDGVWVLYVNHAISDALMVARGLRRVGAKVCSVLVPYHSTAGDTQHAIHRAFSAIGPAHHPAPTHPARFADMMAATVKAAVASVARTALLEGQPWMIVEDGGYAFPALHDDPDLRIHLNTCLGAVEHTTRGRWNYEYAELDGVPRTARNLDRPAVTISGSALKTAHEAGFVAQALLDECHWLMRRDHQFLRHRRVAVVGYGRVGKALARAVAQTDAQVLVVDPAGQEIEPGMHRTSLDEAIASGALLVFGATGTSSFTPSALHTFLRSGNDTLYLASASSKAVEFSDLIDVLDRASKSRSPLATPEFTVDVEPDPSVGTRYHITGPEGRAKHIVLLGNGYPVIFYPPDTHGAPNRAMDPVMTQLFLAAAGLPAAAAFLSPRVHDLDDLRALTATPLPSPWRTLVDEAGLLAQWCALNDVHWPDYAQSIGFPASNAAQAKVPQP
jgi:hypothetical protein